MRDAKKILLLIFAYNAEPTIEKVLKRIPVAIHNYDYEILFISNKSSDHTFDGPIGYKSPNPEILLTELYSPENWGYGGNQKLGFQYAIEKKFDIVALLQCDGPYAPEDLEKLILPVLNEEADAVFVTRTAHKILGTRLSEFHPGDRVYSVKTLKQIPFELNTNDFHFNTEIGIQLKLHGSKIREIPISTCNGAGKYDVNNFVHAWNVIKATMRAKLQQMNIAYHRQFDIVKPEHNYPPKFDFLSSHTMAINEVRSGAHVLDIGCGAGHVGRELEKRNCQVTGVDIAMEEEGKSLRKFSNIDLNRDSIPYPPDSFDFILILDVLEHLDLPSQFNLLEKIRTGSKSKKPAIIITVPNIAFLFIRVQLLIGNFNYGKRGILDMTHRHLFTFKSIRRFLNQAGYKIEKTKGIPLPYPQVMGNNIISRFLLRINTYLIWLVPGLFSYQIFIKATPIPTVKQLLELAEANQGKKG
ncbi:MAG: methyltransferase domain-containing protein [Candidatus Aminicenantes bacterium]|nr:methyltransferase domain-containing protein [Candidatus Aminicenantes bacterium]